MVSTAAACDWQGQAGKLLAAEWQDMVSVKNTFIHVQESQPAGARRTHSQPAPASGGRPAAAALPAAQCADGDSSPRTDLSGKTSDEDERLRCLECCDTESTAARSEVSEANTTATASSTSTPSSKALRGGSFASKESFVSYQQTEHLLELLAPQLPSRHSASCDVHPWTPPAPPGLPALPDFFMQHTGQVVMYAAAVLAASTSPVIDVHTTRDRKGWSIVAKLRPEDLVHTERVVAWAKQAVLQASEQSSCVYVMGYKRSPFRPRPHGFGAVLGLMQDEQTACWDVYKTGACPREHTCQWAHPAASKRLYFVVRPLVPEGADPWACFQELDLHRSGSGKTAKAGSSQDEASVGGGEGDVEDCSSAA